MALIIGRAVRVRQEPLCKLHHAAFDRYLIGGTPDLEVTVRLDVLAEIDGPMLQHGLLHVPGRVRDRSLAVAHHRRRDRLQYLVSMVDPPRYGVGETWLSSGWSPTGPAYQQHRANHHSNEEPVLILLFGLVVSRQINLRRIDGWRSMAAVFSPRPGVAA
jgi:hypothetical protein